MKKATNSYKKNHHKINGKTVEVSLRIFREVSGSGLEKIMGPVCPEGLDPDPVNIIPDPKSCCPRN